MSRLLISYRVGGIQAGKNVDSKSQKEYEISWCFLKDSWLLFLQRNSVLFSLLCSWVVQTEWGKLAASHKVKPMREVFWWTCHLFYPSLVYYPAAICRSCLQTKRRVCEKKRTSFLPRKKKKSPFSLQQPENQDFLTLAQVALWQKGRDERNILEVIYPKSDHTMVRVGIDLEEHRVPTPSHRHLLPS